MKIFKLFRIGRNLLVAGSMLLVSLNLHAAIGPADPGYSIPGIEGSVFDLYAKQAQIMTPDGDSLRIWGFSPSAGGVAQYPGPTLKVQQAATGVTTVVVTLHNTDVPYPVSLEFPGQQNVFCTGAGTLCTDGIEIGEGPLTYTFRASKPGTFMYQSGISPQIQIDMGLFGALIVYPSTPVDTVETGDTLGLAYNDHSTAYDREYMIMHSEMDPKLHYMAQDGLLAQWDNADYHPTLWFYNGRNMPDTLWFPAAPLPQLPHQPYGTLGVMQPGERVLVRVLNAGRNQHPPHFHGNFYDQISRDGNLIMSNDTGGPAPITDVTLDAIPGGTADLIFGWTGKRLNWDAYGTGPEFAHDCSDLALNRPGLPDPDGPGGFIDGYDDTTWEWCPDHGKALADKVVIPENQDLGFGGFYGGSPFLGNTDSLPIGEGGLNPWGAFIHIWHSHSERDLANNDIFPGGAITLMIILKR